MREQSLSMTSSKRAAGTLLLVFGAIALLLAGIGLHGVMSYSSVSQSTSEFGCELPSAANGSDLLRLVLSHGFAVTTSGVPPGRSGGPGIDASAWIFALQSESTQSVKV